MGLETVCLPIIYILQIFITTHFSSGSSSLIDNIYTNINSSWSSGVVYNDLLDHAMGFISVRSIAADAETNFKPNTFLCTNTLLKHIVKQSWDFVTVSSDVHSDYEKLISNIMTSIDLSEHTSIKPNHSKVPCMTSTLLQSCKHKYYLYKKMTKGLVTLDEYKTYYKKLNNLIRIRKSSYYQNICNKNKRNSKVIWNHLNELTGRKICDNKLPADIDANAVNEFFINLGPSTVDNLPASNYHHNILVHYVSHTFFYVGSICSWTKKSCKHLPK